ncbi:MAG: hypothetical protein U0944_00430 [Candidatus Moranbacteria bacterium]|nr:hypothetical protein [Candidatus Moranbacteria bacterium]
MKKISITLGLAAAVILLAGCGQSGIDTGNQAVEAPAPISVSSPTDDASVADDSAAVLPESVSTQPGVTVDEEIQNIDKDMQAIDDSTLEDGLSDADLGV